MLTGLEHISQKLYRRMASYSLFPIHYIYTIIISYILIISYIRYILYPMAAFHHIVYTAMTQENTKFQCEDDKNAIDKINKGPRSYLHAWPLALFGAFLFFTLMHFYLYSFILRIPSIHAHGYSSPPCFLVYYYIPAVMHTVIVAPVSSV